MMLATHPLANPIVWLAFLLLTMIGTLSSVASYEIGKQGLGAIQRRFPRLGEEQLHRIRQMYNRQGPGVLILSGVPVFGGMLSVTAGLLQTDLRIFVLWAGLGKLARNAILLALVELLFLLFAEG